MEKEIIDIITLQEVLIKSAWLLPLVIGLVEVLKQAVRVPARFLPLTSVLIGLAVGLIVIQLSVLGGIVGVILGLGGVGLWEFGKTTIAGK